MPGLALWASLAPQAAQAVPLAPLARLVLPVLPLDQPWPMMMHHPTLAFHDRVWVLVAAHAMSDSLSAFPMRPMPQRRAQRRPMPQRRALLKAHCIECSAYLHSANLGPQPQHDNLSETASEALEPL